MKTCPESCLVYKDATLEDARTTMVLSKAACKGADKVERL